MDYLAEEEATRSAVGLEFVLVDHHKLYFDSNITSCHLALMGMKWSVFCLDLQRQKWLRET